MCKKFKNFHLFLNIFLFTSIVHGVNNKDLLKAVKKGDSCQVKELLKNGADINTQDEDGDTALHLIAMSKASAQNSFTDNYDILHLLMEHQPKSNLKNNKGNTALHYAASFGDMEIVDYLLYYDFSVATIKNKENHTALYYALMHNHETIVDLFLEKIANQEWCKYHMAWIIELLFWQPSKAHAFLAKYKDKPNAYGSTLLFFVKDDSIEIAKILLKLKANVNHKNHNGSTPLAKAGGLNIVNLFLDEGALINQKDRLERNALHNAVFSNKADIALALIKAGIPVSQQDIDRDTPLHHALFMPDEEVATCLIKAGAKTDIKNRAGQTPIDVLWYALIPIDEPLDENGDGKRERLLKLIDENRKAY